MREDTVLVSIMHVNNEIGVIHDIDAIGELCRNKKLFFILMQHKVQARSPLMLNRLKWI